MQSGNEIRPVYAILQNNFFIKKFYEKCGQESSSRLFLIFKESFVKKNYIVFSRIYCFHVNVLLFFIVNFEHISHLVLVFLLVILSR